MRHQARKHKEKRVLGFDLGGTKVALALVTERGKILDEVREPVRVSEGPKALLEQLAGLALGMMKTHGKISAVGIASAGPLDPFRGVLLDPTNFFTDGKSWGKIALQAPLHKKLKHPVRVDNDAAAAALAEGQWGAGKGSKNFMVLTLGTGLGTGIVANGALVRAGRKLHPEAGHLIVKAGDVSAPCGCGNLGCAEAYLSGKNFGLRFAHAHPGATSDAKQISDAAREGNASALKHFDEYSDILATTIHNYVVLYSPERVVVTGSFALASDLFLQKTSEKLEILLTRRRVGVDLLPRLMVSKLGNREPVLGGAYIALNYKDPFGLW